MLGLTRQFSWEAQAPEAQPGHIAVQEGHEAQQRARHWQALAGLQQYVEQVRATSGVELETVFAALVQQSAEEQRLALAGERGWLAGAMRRATTSGAACTPALAAAGKGQVAAPAEVQQALEEMKQLDSMLADLTSKASEAAAAAAAASAQCPRGAGCEPPGGPAELLPSLEALLQRERGSQQHAAAVEQALAEVSGEVADDASRSGTEAGAQGDGSLGPLLPGSNLQQALGPEEELLLQRLLAQEGEEFRAQGSGSAGSSANPFDLSQGCCSPGSEEARRLAEIDARLAELQRGGPAAFGGALDAAGSTPWAALEEELEPELGFSTSGGEEEQEEDVAGARRRLARARKEASRMARRLQHVDSQLRALRVEQDLSA